MRDASVSLAKEITWAGSKQSYFTARWMVDQDLREDAFLAYGYFRWADDEIDISFQSEGERIAFIRRQRNLIDALYKGAKVSDLTPEEAIIANLIKHDRDVNSGLKSYIHNMLAILEFDTYRRGSLISEAEYIWYSKYLAKSVIDGLQYFIKNGHPYPKTEVCYLSAIAAHITHMLRDMHQDIEAGYVNIPREYLDAHGIEPEDFGCPPYRAWVKSQVDLARAYFKKGKRYIIQIGALRYKIVCYWYCTRFDSILETIERDGYCLRAEYPEQKSFLNWLKILTVGISLFIQHFAMKVPFISHWKNAHEPGE